MHQRIKGLLGRVKFSEICKNAVLSSRIFQFENKNLFRKGGWVRWMDGWSAGQLKWMFKLQSQLEKNNYLRANETFA